MRSEVIGVVAVMITLYGVRSGDDDAAESQSLTSLHGADFHLHGAVELAGAAAGIEGDFNGAFLAGSYRLTWKFGLGAAAASVGDADDCQRFVAGVGKFIFGGDGAFVGLDSAEVVGVVGK